MNPNLIYCQTSFQQLIRIKQMSSSNIQTSIPHSLAQSTISTNRFNSSSYIQKKAMTPIVAKRQFDYSKSYVYENPCTKKEGSGLRKTINYDEPLTPTPNRVKLQGFLRNTSYFSIEEDKSSSSYKRPDKSQYVKPKHEKDSWSTNVTSLESKSSNVQKILQKIQKKQKLINELKQLTKFNVTEQVKNNAKDSIKINEKIGANRSVRNSIQDKQQFYQPRKNTFQKQQNFNFDKTNFNSIYKDQKSELVLMKNQNQKKQYKRIQKPDNNNLTVKNKNPQQETGKQVQLKKAKNSYLTPKQTKSYNNIDDRVSSIILMSKKQSIPMKQQKGSEPLYRSCNYNNEMITETKATASRPQQFKSIRDIRQISDVKLIKNNTSYFTNKRLSVYDFQFLQPLGEGKFGSVFKAIHKSTNTIYAIKKISKKVIKSNLMIDQLLKQIKIQCFCQHENILQLYGVFDDLDHVYLILQYMEEGTLFGQLKKRKFLPQNQAAIKLKQVAKAIIYLHDNGIAHRDIKPENIVMSHGVGKLCDFGWATFCGNDRRKTYCGTFDYAAPQILEGSQYDITVDLWCLGVLAYQLLVGKAPFFHYSRKQTMKKILNVENQSAVYPSHISKEAISFIDSLIRKNPEQRMNGKSILDHSFIRLAQLEQ